MVKPEFEQTSSAYMPKVVLLVPVFVKSAAYRSASRLRDERTGEIHSYDRKGGVIHCEVLAPESTPD